MSRKNVLNRCCHRWHSQETDSKIWDQKVDWGRGGGTFKDDLKKGEESKTGQRLSYSIVVVLSDNPVGCAAAKRALQSCPCLEAKWAWLGLYLTPHHHAAHRYLTRHWVGAAPPQRTWSLTRLLFWNKDNPWLGIQLRVLSHWYSHWDRNKHLSSKEESRQHTRASTIEGKPQRNENGEEGLSR